MALSATGSDTEALLGWAMIVIPIASVPLIKWIVLRAVSKLMFQQSDEAGTDLLASEKPVEDKVDHRPTFKEFTASSEMTDAVSIREAYAKRALSSFRKHFLYGCAACAAYVLFPWLLSLVFAGSSDALMLVAIVAVFYFLVVLLTRYWLYRKQFRALDFKLGARIEHPSTSISRAYLAPKNEAVMVGIFIFLMIIVGLLTFMEANASAEETDFYAPAVGVGIFMAMAFHLWLIFTEWSKAQVETNLTLTHLRVFGLDNTAGFTFGGILRFWHHYGSYFTVVDPSFMRHQFRFWSLRSLFTIIGVLLGWLIGSVALTLLLGVQEGQSDASFEVTAVPMLIVTLILFALANYRRIVKSFARSEEDIDSRMNKLLKKPRNLGLEFKSMPLACFDNTWRLAVLKFVAASNVVLMDLRGFSKERKGCEYEVDFLFDNIEIDRIVFLLDGESDREAVEQLILERWEYLSVGSPNFHEADHVAQIYASEQQEKSDMQALIDVLIQVADKSDKSATKAV